MEELLDEIKLLIVDEIIIAQKEGEETSRLTSLYLKIDKLINKFN